MDVLKGLAACLVVLALVPGCGAPPVTQIVVRIDSDMEAGPELSSLRVQARRTSGPIFADREATLGRGPGRVTLPTTLGLLTSRPDDDHPVEVLVAARVGGGRDFTHRAVVRFRAEHVVVLDVFLARACTAGPVPACSATQTCGPDGRCQEAERGPLPDFDPDGGLPARPDVAVDAPADVALDQGPEVRADTGSEVRLDTGMDVRWDAGGDVRWDAGMDAGPPCLEGTACTPAAGACWAGVVRCVAGIASCPATTPRPAGTVAGTVVCDGSGGSTPVTGKRSCTGSEPACSEITVARGTLTLGEDGGVGATPVQPMITVEPFVIDATEVTVARFNRFWSIGHPEPAGGVQVRGATLAWTPATTRPPGSDATCNWSAPTVRANHPMNCLNWWTALAFCAWEGGRLPTEAEWELAARGPGMPPSRVYPWGDEDPTGSPGGACLRAQWHDCAGQDGAPTRPVGSFAPGVLGTSDQAGNVWELTLDSWALYSDPTCWGGTARINPSCRSPGDGEMTVRGGSYSTERLDQIHSAGRVAYHNGTTGPDVGFRCAHDVR